MIFQIFKTIRFFGREIYSDNSSLDDVLEQQTRLQEDIDFFSKNLQKQKNQLKKKKKEKLLKMQLYFLMEGKKFLMLLEVEYFL